VLDWVASAGFEEFFKRFDMPHKTAQEYRQRYLTAAIKGMLQMR
jgi:hypothetical protein